MKDKAPNQLVELTRMRVNLFLREPEAIFWVFVFPLVLAAVLGFAFRSGGEVEVPIGVLEGPGADRVAAALAIDPALDVERFEDRDEARRLLRKAAVDVLVDPAASAEEVPTLHLDEGRPEAQNARVRILRALELAANPDRAATVRIEPMEEKGSRYVDFLFPGLLGMNLMGTGMWGVGFAIADVRRRKFLKRMIVTPMKKSSFFLSFLLSRLVFLEMELVALVAIGAWALDVPFRCNLLDFGVVAVVGAAVFAGIGILVASRAKTIEAVSGLMNLVMMPMWLGSGVFFSYERFPDVTHGVLRLLPLTGLNDALRALMIDGVGITAVLPQLGVQLFWGVLSIGLALKIFRWQ